MVKKFKVTNINGVPYFYEILKKLKISRENYQISNFLLQQVP